MSPLNNSSFDFQQQNRLFDAHGDLVELFPGRRCSCASNLDTNRGNPNCRVCLGLGYFYTTSTFIVGLVTGITSQKILMESGIALPGDMLFSQRMMDPVFLTDMDMIRLSTWDGQPYEGDVVLRGDGATDTLVYTATDIQSVTQSNEDTGVVTTYVEGTDFTHALRSNQLVWLGVNDPAQNSSYAVKYLAVFDWVVFAPPNQRYERATPLGNRVLMRKKHLVARSAT